MIHQVVFDTSKILSEHGIQHVVHSPGSRNAPLTVSLARNKDLKIYNIVDERSAAFIALGIAQKTKKPVVLCCTSGTSLLNYAPAVAEAFYQEIPLIILSADRPPEWIGQRDGQTIDQIGALRNFVLAEFQLPVVTNTTTAWEYSSKLNQGINLSQNSKGPTHLNVPFREPFYPKEHQELTFSSDVHVVKEPTIHTDCSDSTLEKAYANSKRVLILVGQQPASNEFSMLLQQLSNYSVIISDVISNVKADSISYHDHFLPAATKQQFQELKPDLMISFGKSVISKSLKFYLRKHKPSIHLHVEDSESQADTFQSITHRIKANGTRWLQALVKNDFPILYKEERGAYIKTWSTLNNLTKVSFEEVKQSLDFCEYTAFEKVITNLPDEIDLHLANSMSVRYANLIPKFKPAVEVFSNRGTSGIDGTNGTAVGNSLVSEKTTYLLTGDLSFFYDVNAFFHNYSLKNLKIIISNNQGGGIFSLINGPSDLPELKQHFETQHRRNASLMAKEFGFNYHTARTTEEIEKAMASIAKSEEPEILEIFSDTQKNTTEFKKMKKLLGEKMTIDSLPR